MEHSFRYLYVISFSADLGRNVSQSKEKNFQRNFILFWLYLINKSMNVYLQKDEEALTIKGFDPSNWVGDKQNTLDSSLL